MEPWRSRQQTTAADNNSSSSSSDSSISVITRHGVNDGVSTFSEAYFFLSRRNIVPYEHSNIHEFTIRVTVIQPLYPARPNIFKWEYPMSSVYIQQYISIKINIILPAVILPAVIMLS